MFVGPWLAVKFSIKQFRSTKSWEHATEAYSVLLKELAILRHTNRQYYEHFINARRMNDADMTLCQAEHQGARRAIERVAVANRLFISTKVRDSVDVLIGKMEQYCDDPVEHLEAESIAIDDCLQVIDTAAPMREKH